MIHTSPPLYPVVARQIPRPFVHRPTETLDTPAILSKGASKGDPATGITIDEREKTKQSQFRATDL